MARGMCELRVFAINNMIVVKCFPNSFIFISPVSGSHFDCNCDDGMWVVYGYVVEEEEELLFPSLLLQFDLLFAGCGRRYFLFCRLVTFI